MKYTIDDADYIINSIYLIVKIQQLANSSRSHSILIHGHTHRPAVHTFEAGGQSRQRIVLPDWYDNGGYLTLTDIKQIALKTLPA